MVWSKKYLIFPPKRGLKVGYLDCDSNASFQINQTHPVPQAQSPMELQRLKTYTNSRQLPWQKKGHLQAEQFHLIKQIQAAIKVVWKMIKKCRVVWKMIKSCRTNSCSSFKPERNEATTMKMMKSQGKVTYDLSSRLKLCYSGRQSRHLWSEWANAKTTGS